MRARRSFVSLDFDARLSALRAAPAASRLQMMRPLTMPERQQLWNALSPSERADIVKAQGSVPSVCSDKIPVAPARGRIIPWTPRRLERMATGELRVVEDGHLMVKPGRVSDVFDVMEARRPKRAKKAGPLFSAAQVEAARDYRALTERVEASGMRGMSIETMGGGSRGGADGFLAAVLDDTARLRRYHAEIGDGVALAVRRIRPSARGGDSRVGIRDRFLVDRVCLAQMTVQQVLEACGWAKNERTLKGLQDALAAALDRMCGLARERG